MTKKQLRIFFILFIFCVLGVSLFYLLDKGKQKEIENQAVLNLEGISLVLLNSHSSPQAQSNWTVSFETKGKADLTITPDDPGTINHLDFISLTCNEQERTAQILDNDVILYPNWSCEGVGKVTHLVNVAGHHTLVFQFGNQTAYAYNNPDAVTDTFDDESKIYSKSHLVFSGGQVRLAMSFTTCGDTLFYEEKEYNTVQIGTQCWVAENLDYDNGCKSKTWVNDSDIGWCGYYDGAASDDTYGLLYQWSAAMNGTTTEGVQGICPSGWHLPSHDDWTDLERQICSDIGNTDCETTFPKDKTTTDYRGDGESPAMAASTTLWVDGLLKQNDHFASSGLDVFPAGYRNYDDGTDVYRSETAYLWTSTKDSDIGSNAWTRGLEYIFTGVDRGYYARDNAFSVRCLKD